MSRPAWIVRGSPGVLAAWLGITGLAVLAIVRLDPPGLRIAVDPSSEPLLPANDPSRDEYRRATLQFGGDDIYVVAMETEDLFTTENLAALRRVTDRIRQLTGVREAESLTNVISFRYVAADDWVEVRPFLQETPREPLELAAVRERALANPFYRKTLLSRDGRSAAINVTFRDMSDADFVRLDLDGRIREILRDEAGEGRRFFVAGRPHVRAEAHHLMVRDLVRLIPLAVAVAMFALWLLTGSLRGTLIPLASCLSSTLWTYGALAAVGKDLNLITLVLGPTLICVGCVYAIHVVGLFELLAPTAPDARHAAHQCLSYARVPVLMAGGTTCVGFGALTLTDMPAVRELGGFCVFGVACVTLIALSGVPALLARSEPGVDPAIRAAGWARARARLSSAVTVAIERLLDAAARWTRTRPGPVLACWTLLTLVAVAAIPSIVVDTDFLSFFDRRSRVRTDFAAVNRLLAGAVPIYVSLESDREGTFRDPERLRLLVDLQERLERQPGVDQVLSMVDLVRIANRAFEEEGTDGLRIPDSRSGAAETVFLIPKERLRRYANANHSGANLVIRTGKLGSAAVRELEAGIHATLAAAALPPGLRATVTANTLLVNHSADRIAGDQARTVGSAAAAILVLVSLVFRSLRLGLLAMIPNIVPVLLFFGFLGLFGVSLSIPTSLIGAIVLGIAIDDTVHLLVAYRRARARDLSPEAAAHEALHRVGRPIVFTSIMLFVGFLVITISNFATLREFGLLTAMTMVICLATDLLLMPALLIRLRA